MGIPEDFEKAKQNNDKRWVEKQKNNKQILAKQIIKCEGNRQLMLNEEGEVTYITNSGKRKVLEPYDPKNKTMLALRKGLEAFEYDDPATADRIIRTAIRDKVKTHLYGTI